MTSSKIEPATFRFVAQHLNHCATAVPHLCVTDWHYYVDRNLQTLLSPLQYNTLIRDSKASLWKAQLRLTLLLPQFAVVPVKSHLLGSELHA